MNRFAVTLLIGAAMTALALGSLMPHETANAAADGRLYYELRAYDFASPDQQARFMTYLADAAIPAYNRIGVEPVGVFEPTDGKGPVWVLLPHKTLDSVSTAGTRLLADKTYRTDGATFLALTKADPLFQSYTTSVLHAFDGMPGIEHPSDADSRVFQLRIYANPTETATAKKVEMFETAELDIFREVGINPVLFSTAISGPDMPNITYMVGYDNEDAMKAAWKAFGKNPKWQELRAIPEYSDDVLIRGITNIVLKPAAPSQM